LKLLQQLQGRVVVSCQAYEGEAMFGADNMAAMAQAAMDGGAVAIRANSPADIRAIKMRTGLPVIGIWKRHYLDSEVYITPTFKDVLAVSEEGAEIVAMDATHRPRPMGETLSNIVQELKSVKTGTMLMADVSTYEEGISAEQLGFDMVSTTLSGYTDYSELSTEPDYKLIERLSARLTIPVVGEGRIHTVEQAERCLASGAHFIVIGTAITRPQVLTGHFVEASKRFRMKAGL